ADPARDDRALAIDEIAVETAELALLPRHAELLDVGLEMTEGGSRVVLLRGGSLARGQGIRRSGVLVPRLSGEETLRDHTISAALHGPPLAAATWSGDAALGPFASVSAAPSPAAVQRARQAFARSYERFVERSG